MYLYFQFNNSKVEINNTFYNPTEY